MCQLANKGGTAETTAFSSLFLRTRALFIFISANVLVAKAKRQLQMSSVAKATRQLQLRQGEIDFENWRFYHEKILFIGAGSMAEALIQGWIKQKVFTAQEIYVTNRTDKERLQFYTTHIM